MNRRETFKTILVGVVTGSALASGTTSCVPDQETISPPTNEPGLYGRTPSELEHDRKIMAEVFLNEQELSTIAVLCDIILPASTTAGSATEAEVPAFIDFIVKDLPQHQLPLRGGLMWLDIESRNRFGKSFKDGSNANQIALVEDLAYPDSEAKNPELAPGIKFFSLMRNLTMTGYYTTKMGIDDLGYIGNYANTWDGVPAEVLAKHDVDYEAAWLAKCVDQEKRNIKAEWDDAGNLLT